MFQPFDATLDGLNPNPETFIITGEVREPMISHRVLATKLKAALPPTTLALV